MTEPTIQPVAQKEPMAEIDEKITRITEAAKRLEDANAKAEVLLGKQILAGRADAGAPQQAPEESPKDYTQRIMAGRL